VTRFEKLVGKAAADDREERVFSRTECLNAAREFTLQRRAEIYERHRSGESGSNVVRLLSDMADAVVHGAFLFALHSARHRRHTVSRVAVCALGGYGRAELSPHSDLDVCLVYEGVDEESIELLSNYLVPFLWDTGFVVGHSALSLEDALDLARSDSEAFTSLLESRLITGNSMPFARMKLSIRELQFGGMAQEYVRERVRERYEALPESQRDLFNPEPDIKENAGGLRDFHTAFWSLMVSYGATTLDDAVSQGLVAPEEQLETLEALDFIWRVRNEMHFHTGKTQDTLTFALQGHVASALGYTANEQPRISNLMQDYYSNARQLRRFLQSAAKICDCPTVLPASEGFLPEPAHVAIRNNEIHIASTDEKWFSQYPPRLMEIFWECARRRMPISRSAERLIAANLHLVNDTFRSSDVVRRYFVAMCSRPYEAGFALRQAAAVGLLRRYIPEFGEVSDIIRYEDFHHYPVDEHTLRAEEALAALEHMHDPVGRCLRESLEHLSDVHILILAILFHDLGKAEGEVHVDASVRLMRQVSERMGLSQDDEERIAFLVQNHLLMTNISQFRDIDDESIVRSFADTVKTEQRLRTLFLLTYADLSAVGPNVWNEWKGALLLKLYLRAEKMLLGRAETLGEEAWRARKAAEVREVLVEPLADEAEEHLRSLGERYLVAFSAQQIAGHLQCVAAARNTGLALHASANPATGMSEVVICTRDRQGLFAQLAGSFAACLVDVNGAALFTRPDGYVIDVFTVTDARTRRPLTPGEFAQVERTMRAVLLEGKDIRGLVEQSRRRLFALLQPRIPVRTRIDFDNHSSRTHTVIDVETGDRTGLLYDLARAMAESGLDISTARIVTDARRVRDSFYVTLDGRKVEDAEKQKVVREYLHDAIHPKTAIESKGGIS
jgi:[protein-PII] uridylyltransferase